MPARLLMILTENHTMIDPRDIGALVELARIAEAAGFDAAMISEQVILGRTPLSSACPTTRGPTRRSGIKTR